MYKTSGNKEPMEIFESKRETMTIIIYHTHGLAYCSCWSSGS
jgi:hypothetical protein